MKTIKNNLKNELEIKNSKFITYIYKVNTLEEINNYLKEIRNKYKDSTHICYAYIIDNINKCSDDNEPSHTAGLPILNVLKKKELTNILAIVIRYFGGIKLGVGGLTRAYTNSITNTIKDEEIITLTKGYNINIYFNYDKQKQIDYLLINSIILTKEYYEIIKYNLNISENDLKKLKEANIKIEIIKTIYF